MVDRGKPALVVEIAHCTRVYRLPHEPLNKIVARPRYRDAIVGFGGTVAGR
jgi:hypothetical protein